MILLTIFLSCLNILASLAKGDNSVDPIQQLMQSSFPVMDQYMPSGKDLKIKKLLRRLGNDFVSEWMSIKKPIVVDSTSDTGTNEGSVGDPENDEYIRTLETQLELNNKTKEQLISIMQEMMICKTKFTWKRLEPLLWPKYIKEGSCVEKKHCSITSDMACRMGNEKVLKILHWSCRKRKVMGTKRNGKTQSNRKHNNRLAKNMKVNLRANLKCRWRKISYNVDTRCECSCS